MKKNKSRFIWKKFLALLILSLSVVMAWERLVERAEEREELKRILFAAREQTSTSDIQWVIHLFERLGIKEETLSYLDQLANRCEISGRLAPIPALLLERFRSRLE
jgi:geranylgeranyl pyrophosphate synthase